VFVSTPFPVADVIVVAEAHLRRVLRAYLTYYERSRTHLSLEKDARVKREAQPSEIASVVKLPEVSGLHRRYARRAA